MERQLPSGELHLITTGKQSLDEVVQLFQSVIRQAGHRLANRSLQLSNLSETHDPLRGIHLHIREKHRTAREQMEWYRTLQALLPQTHIYMNDRLDAALEVGAAGVQLAWHSVSIETAKAMLPASCRIGVSIHSAKEAEDMKRRGANFVLFGHIYSTNSKPGQPGRGVHALADLVQSVQSVQQLPVIALGGIHRGNIDQVLATGCSGAAVMSAFFDSQDPYSELIALNNALDKRRS